MALVSPNRGFGLVDSGKASRSGISNLGLCFTTEARQPFRARWNGSTTEPGRRSALDTSAAVLTRFLDHRHRIFRGATRTARSGYAHANTRLRNTLFRAIIRAAPILARQ